ncbi:MAG TPA: adenylate/guanylate cyclase domain-containing protein [Burkholderiales bacterium]|nr:adenylate/guanylate cyclase domain-containing protein [Burkholderiales bacterium]
MPRLRMPFQSLITRRNAVWSGFVILLLYSLAVPYFPQARDLDAKLLDLEFRWLQANAPKPVTRDVVIVGIDEDTTRVLFEPIALWHPHFGKFFEAMVLARPAAVALDVVFPDRSYDRLLREYDRPLVAGILQMRTAGVPLVLGQTLDEQSRLRHIFPPYLAVAGPDSVALVLFPLDDDEVARRYRASFPGDAQQPLVTFATRTAAHVGAPSQDGMIDYARGGAYSYVPMQQVLAWREANDVESLRKAFGGRPVLLGSVMPLFDRYRTPVALAAWEPDEFRVPGVLIHAQALRSLMHGGLIQPAPSWLTTVLPILAVLLWWITARMWATAAALLGLALAAVTATLLLHNGTYLPVAGALMAGYTALLSRTGMESFFNLREKRQLKNSFGRYVSPAVLNEILAGRIKAGLGGARKNVCVLFSDIRGFTHRSEGQSPEAVIGFLNRYFTEMVAAIHAHGGTLDKFIGDGIMAFFGAPEPRKNAAQDAFDCAREMLTRLDALNVQLAAEGIEPIHIGIGLHGGEVLVGHIGSEARHEYSAIGDPVNVASRLESLTKEVGYPIVCSHVVADVLTSRDGFVELGEHAIKGHTPVAVFGYRPPLSAG